MSGPVMSGPVMSGLGMSEESVKGVESQLALAERLADLAEVGHVVFGVELYHLRGIDASEPEGIESRSAQLHVVAGVGEQLLLPDRPVFGMQVPDFAVESVARLAAPEDAAQHVLLVHGTEHHRGRERSGVVDEMHARALEVLVGLGI